MSALLLEVFEKFVLPWLLQELVKSGILTQLEASAITSLEEFKTWLGTLKAYSSPTDFPNAPPDPTPNNLTTGQEPSGDYPSGR